MAAMWLHPLTQHPVTHSTWGGGCGMGPCHAGAGYSPREAGMCQGQQWLLTLDAGGSMYHSVGIAALLRMYWLHPSPAWISLGAGIGWWQCPGRVSSGFPDRAIADATRVLALHAPVALPSPCARRSVIPPALFPSGPGPPRQVEAEGTGREYCPHCWDGDSGAGTGLTRAVSALERLAGALTYWG